MQISSAQLESLPIQIAERVVLASNDENDRVRLWTSFEITEAVLRWVFATTASALHTRHGQLSDKLLRLISTSIRRPTLASWCVMNEALAKELTKDQERSTFGLAFAEFYLRFADHPEFGDTWRSLAERRNNVAHGGGLTSPQARQQWETTARYLTAILADLSKCHEEYRVFASLSGELFDLCGVEPRAVEGESSFVPDSSEDSTWLVRSNGEHSNLRPLLTYEPIEEVWEIDQFRSQEVAYREPVPQSYFKLSEGKLYYIPIGVDDFVSIGKDTSQFAALFPEPVRSGVEQLQSRFFREARIKHLSRFTGRTAELSSLEAWLADRVPAGDIVGLVVGGPGLGKSALIAQIAMTQIERIASLNRDDRRVVYHAFNAENPANDRRLFLHNLRQQLQGWLKKPVLRSQDISDVEPAEQSVRNLLEQALGDDSQRHLTIFVDGLDEIRSLDRAFPGSLVEMVRTGVTIVASTRNEEFVADFDAALKVERIPFNDGAMELPGMRDGDVRGLLLQNLGARGREIIELDSDTEDQSSVRNPYIEKVVEHAAGKPLYVELLVSDLLDNNARIDPNVRLPASMGDYYGKLLARQGVSDTKAHLAIILCLLSFAEEPLAEAVLVDLIALTPNHVDGKDHAAAWVREALNQGEVFFSRLIMPDGSETVTIYHQELRGFIRGASQLRWANGLAAWLMVSAAARFDDGALSPATNRHFQKFGAIYALDLSHAVQPQPLTENAQIFVHENYLSPTGLNAGMAAWLDDRESFLRTFNRIDVRLRQGADDDPRQRVGNFLRHSISRSAGGVGPSVVHSILGYDDAAKPLYRELLELAVSASFADSVEHTEATEIVMTDWMANTVGADRRNGALDTAEERIDRAMERLAKLDPDEASDAANRVRSKLEYERGYCAYFRGDEDLAWEVFENSARAARLANDPIGVHISQSVQKNVSIRFARAKGEIDQVRLDAYRRFLNEQIETLQEITTKSDNERERTAAERWVMNCKSHLCGVAYLNEDAAAFREWYELLVTDPWVRKQGDAMRTAILNRIEPRLLVVEGDLDGAIRLYERFLPTLSSVNSPGAREEGVAEYYLEFAQLLISAGRSEEAEQVVRSGLATDDTFANAKWKVQLRSLL